MNSLRHLVSALRTLRTSKVEMPDIDNRHCQPRLVRQLVGAVSNQELRDAATSVSYAINHAISELRATGIKSLNGALLDLARAGTYGRKSDNRARYVLQACREIRRVGRDYLHEEELKAIRKRQAAELEVAS